MNEGDLASILEAVKKYPGKRPLILEIVNAQGIVSRSRRRRTLAVGDESSLLEAVSTYAV